MADHVIVVVDDDRLTLKLMEVVLAQAGYQPVLCADAEHAYALIRNQQPDLVTLDLQMGGNSEAGWEILSLLRMDAATAHIPVILCSGNGHFLQERREVLRAQGCAVLEKPFDLDVLLAKIGHLLRPPPARQHAAGRSGVPNETTL